MNRRLSIRAAIVIFGLVAGWFLFFGLPKWYGTRHAPSPAPAAASAATSTGGGSAVRRITATLFYMSEDGMSLAPVQREVPFGANVAEQARAILEAQIVASPPLFSAIPADTKRDLGILINKYVK